MYRIDNSTAVAIKPAKEAAGTQGYWTKGDPAQGIPATVMDQDFFNMLQGELKAILDAAGITPDKADDAQVVAAIQSLISAAGGGASSSEDFLQPTHGFAKFDTLYHNGTIWVKGQADVESTSIVSGVVSNVIDTDNFTITYSGVIEWDVPASPDYTVGNRVYLSNTTAGALSDTKPTYAIGEVDKLVGYSIPTGLLVMIDKGDVVSAPIVGSVWNANVSKTDNYTILDSDLQDLIYLDSSVTVDKTFTLKATPADGDTVWVCNQNEIDEARLAVNDGVDDILYLGLSDGVYKFVYSSVASAWTSTTA